MKGRLSVFFIRKERGYEQDGRMKKKRQKSFNRLEDEILHYFYLLHRGMDWNEVWTLSLNHMVRKNQLTSFVTSQN